MLRQKLSGGGDWARVCETCRSAPCTVYCRADCAYLCTGCDGRIHGANEVASRHERVWVCEACEGAPAAFLCKADAASLCAACDAEIHSANPLASRHIRVPIRPVSGWPGGRMETESEGEEEANGDEDEAASWLLLNPTSTPTPTTVKKSSSNINNQHQNSSNEFIILQGEVDQYLDLCDYTSAADNHFSHHSEFTVPKKNSGAAAGAGDSVVPVQCGEGNKDHHFQNFLFGMDSESKSVMESDIKSEYNYSASFCHSVSVSSLDVGVVPEFSTSDLCLSHPIPRPPKGTIDLFSNPPVQMPTQLSAVDREARVMRYREKKKTRKFEKTIRYASRKAYAETRPRIKGRFAKRSDVEAEMDHMFPTSHLAESGYGIVPSF